MSDGIDPKLVQKINHILAESGERERLKEILRRKLEDSGWTVQVRKQCEYEVKASGNLNNLSPQDIVDRVGPNARNNIPSSVQNEMLQEIRKFLEINLR